eukprot:TRINITY_DN11801_c0_g1_i1.p1 TRINITY_DN11801_c0_g1~~TRINITY_DN11801_c0_g1_i1.p1  ORF type:complete len:393 (+),score=136.94 TRINITY_DN11801_c0_g1_i1:142-1179(+)
MYNYIRSIGFEETPDYSFLRSELRIIFQRENFIDDGLYDWVTIENYPNIPTHLLQSSSLVTIVPSASISSLTNFIPHPTTTTAGASVQAVMTKQKIEQSNIENALSQSAPSPPSPSAPTATLGKKKPANHQTQQPSQTIISSPNNTKMNSERLTPSQPLASSLSPKPIFSRRASEEEYASREVSCCALLDGTRDPSPNIRDDFAEMKIGLEKERSRQDENDQDDDLLFPEPESSKEAKRSPTRKSNSFFENAKPPLLSVPSPSKEITLPLINNNLMFSLQSACSNIAPSLAMANTPDIEDEFSLPVIPSALKKFHPSPIIRRVTDTVFPSLKLKCDSQVKSPAIY